MVSQLQQNELLENQGKNMQPKSCFSKTSSIGVAKIILKSYHEEMNDLLLKRIELGDSKWNSGTHGRVYTPECAVCFRGVWERRGSLQMCPHALPTKFLSAETPPSMVQGGDLAD